MQSSCLQCILNTSLLLTQVVETMTETVTVSKSHSIGIILKGKADFLKPSKRISETGY